MIKETHRLNYKKIKICVFVLRYSVLWIQGGSNRISFYDRNHFNKQWYNLDITIKIDYTYEEI